jgi:hypothetical protein
MVVVGWVSDDEKAEGLRAGTLLNSKIVSRVTEQIT